MSMLDIWLYTYTQASRRYVCLETQASKINSIAIRLAEMIVYKVARMF